MPTIITPDVISKFVVGLISRFGWMGGSDYTVNADRDLEQADKDKSNTKQAQEAAKIQQEIETLEQLKRKREEEQKLILIRQSQYSDIAQLITDHKCIVHIWPHTLFKEQSSGLFSDIIDHIFNRQKLKATDAAIVVDYIVDQNAAGLFPNREGRVEHYSGNIVHKDLLIPKDQVPTVTMGMRTINIPAFNNEKSQQEVRDFDNPALLEELGNSPYIITTHPLKPRIFPSTSFA